MATATYTRYPTTGGGGGAPSGPAGGDLSGTYPNPLVEGFGGYANFPVADGTAGQVLSTNANGTTSWITAGGGSGDISNGGNTFGANVVLGANDNFSTILEANNTQGLKVYPSSAVGIGPASALYDIIQGPAFPFAVGASEDGTSTSILANDSVDPTAQTVLFLSVGNAIGSDNTAVQFIANAPNDGSSPAKLTIRTNNLLDGSGGDIEIAPGGPGNIELSPTSGAINANKPFVSNALFTANGVIVSNAALVSTPELLGVGTDIDWSLGNIFERTLTANTVLTFSTVTPGQIIYVEITGDATNPFTIDIPNTVKGYVFGAFPVNVPPNEVFTFALMATTANVSLLTVAGPFT